MFFAHSYFITWGAIIQYDVLKRIVNKKFIFILLQKKLNSDIIYRLK